MEPIQENIIRVKRNIAEAAIRSGRQATEIELIAVSKTRSTAEVNAAMEAGLTVFGENKVQELQEKAPALPSHLRWHFIGHLQKNKARKALPLAHCIESLDSIELAHALDRIAGELGLGREVYLQVNIGDDQKKFGLSAAATAAAVETISKLPNLQLLGLMTIPPFNPDPEKARPHFAALRALRDSVSAQTGNPLPQLSMGMSGDYEVAIEEGATTVRVGTGIFGTRN